MVCGAAVPPNPTAQVKKLYYFNMSIPRSLLVRFGGIVLAASGLCLIWLQAQQPPKQPLNVQKVTDHLWVIMNAASGNVAVLPTDEGVLLVDDKFEQDGPDILAKVKAISDKPIKYILNTHQHGDHTGGNAFMLKNTPAEIVIHKNARANMVAGKQPGLPQITFADEAQVFVGGREVSAHHLGRGHTNGDAVILFPSERVLHTGDLFVNGSAPFIDYSAKPSGASGVGQDARSCVAAGLRHRDPGARAGGEEGGSGEVAGVDRAPKRLARAARRMRRSA